MESKMFKIGELAKTCHIKTDTLRFYEKHGLLSPSMRSDNGYRLYSQTDADRLKFILRAKSVGFSLKEISALLTIELDKANRACSDVKALVDSKITEVEQKIAELNCFRKSLKTLSKACCGGPESAEHCSILESLETAQESGWEECQK